MDYKIIAGWCCWHSSNDRLLLLPTRPLCYAVYYGFTINNTYLCSLVFNDCALRTAECLVECLIGCKRQQ